MPRITIIQSGMSGVDMTTNPLFLPQDRLAAATNMVFEEGVIKTRPGFRYHDLGTSGQFQGAAVYSPSRGISHQPFADPYTALVTAVSGSLSYNLSGDCYLAPPVSITGNANISKGDVNIYQAENYLIVQSKFSNTLWWEGFGEYTVSPGLGACEDTVADLLLQADVNAKSLPGANIDCCFQKIDYCEIAPILESDADFSSHDTLIFSNHRNFLINSAGLGIYTNGRIHQESHSGIFVSDIIHKRGTRYTDDILLMEEQQAGSFGDPLSTNSRLGQLRAMEVLPEMGTANGEGLLVAYYDSGVVSFNTAAAPRETRYDAETGEMLQKGWSEGRQISHMLNRVSATGRYAVAVLPRDHAFRSRYGVHLLRSSLGDGVFSDEYINTLSQDLQPILDADVKSSLKGVTTGHWPEGSRLLVSVGMVENSLFTSSAMARGFIVWNQATTYTEDRTPRPLWEGLWSVHSDIAGIHRLLDATSVGGDNLFGFIASRSCDAELLFGEIDGKLTHDAMPDASVPIEWDVTSRKVFGGFGKLSRVTDGRLELEATGEGGRVRVLIRTDASPRWREWHSAHTGESAATTLHSINLGQPPRDCREASWFQFKVEGLGHCALRMLEAEVSEDRDKLGKPITTHDITDREESYHKINQSHYTTRWT
jgi:hypothetical protein